MATDTAPRTDRHRPSAPEFDPQGYDLVDVFDLHPEEGDGRERGRVVRALVEQGYRFTSVHGSSQCGHCGAHIRYAALMLHPETMGMIYIGEQCLDNRFDAGLTAGKFQALRKAAKLNRERKIKDERILDILEAHPLLDRAIKEGPAVFGEFVEDVLFKLTQYGELSIRQIEAVERAITRHDEREAERAAKPPAAPVPTGAQHVVGTVVTVRSDPNPYAYGHILKMLVEGEDGWRVWGTMPASLMGLDVDKGTKVEFDATLEVSGRDESFGFFKRPRKARVV
jgi:hypothetical protein